MNIVIAILPSSGKSEKFGGKLEVNYIRDCFDEQHGIHLFSLASKNHSTTVKRIEMIS